ncbi:hypothetical protein D3C76_829850 [compost metagenome]
MHHAIAHGQPAITHRLHLLQHLAQARRHIQRLPQRGLRQHDDELVAAPARQQVQFAQAGAQAFGHPDQRRIATGVTVAVIDRFEIIHVHGDQRQRLAEALGALALPLQRALQPVTVGNTGQRIAFGQFTVFVQLPLQLLVHPGQLTGAFGHLKLQRLVLLFQLSH